MDLRRLLVLLAVLAVITTACAGTAPQDLVGEHGKPTPEPTPTLAAGGGGDADLEPAEAAGATYALTGVVIDEAADPDALARPALGIKIDNAPQARPQLGLGDADIVFEELVEGGVTRFLAVYQSSDPGEAGPVRSGREVDADIFPPFGGVLAISGAAAPTYDVLFSAGLTVFEEGQAGGAIYRVADRPAPHNLNAIARRLWDSAADAPPALPPWPIDAAIPPGGSRIGNVRTAMSDEYAHSWAWRPADGVFERGQNGTRHVAADGEQIGAANVVYATVQVGAGGGVDSSGAATVSIALIDSGPATYLRDGQLFTGTWRKTARESQFEWLDAQGNPFPLAPGRTWVELLPAGRTVEPDAAEVSADAPTEPPTEPATE